MLIVSDLHFGQLEQQAIDHFVSDVLEDQDQVVIICGDLTQTSADEEYEQAKEFIRRLLQLNVRVVVTLGNHDFSGPLKKLHRVTSHYQRARSHAEELMQIVFQQDGVIAANEFDYVMRIGNDVFVSLLSEHRKCPRIKGDQVEWAVNVLVELQGEDLRFHLVTHHSIWEDKNVDKHETMNKCKRLEEQLLQRFQFFTFMHGHNHRFTWQDTTTSKVHYRMFRLSMPTLSPRNKKWEKGYVKWSILQSPVETHRQQVPMPQLIDIDLQPDTYDEKANPEDTDDGKSEHEE